ncbi:MAG: PD-(D/E)XK nuclease family protein [Candidatus Sungbacteria bacterium]|nr:PD-(D/E)XK nuclease family protein [Candidatus Sungbacteria bacterium]
MIKISPSGISSLLECPRCLWLQVNEEKKRPRGIYPSLPDGMDNVFKKYFDAHRGTGTMPPEIDGKVEGALFGDLARLNAWREFNFGRGGIKAEIKPDELGLQQGLFEGKESIVLSGAIDDLLVAPDGKFVPFDFKTRGYPLKEDTHEHYRYQLDLYGLLFRKNNMEPAEYGYLLFFWPESYEPGSARFTTQLIRMDISPSRGLSILKKAYEIITGSKPDAHKSCEYCAYREA